MPAARRAIPIQPLPANAEWHIAGIVVHAMPDRLPQVRAAIDAITGAEVHAASDAGKLVVTIEAPTSRAIAAHLTYLHQLPGVLSAALVYQHNEDADAMSETIHEEGAR
ncbi:chaperone NapD [Cupriavidus sp. WGlv3]|uniref:chaperone NapD n=1 Tax=Cupriavidus sp. WGlv3 TaxID=2919924 RepID=UPI002090C775|nr:chaperone NapD [Cupriavidus sp. WGlv3]MCO4864983.1 chaperone NapD [Cupriavidus sp. WGlv3]